jgi:hypothetical protein
MDGGQLTAIIIVGLIMLGSIIRAGIRGPRRAPLFSNPQGEAENHRLRDEVSELKERIKVLERITVEKENSLAKEIESLRDR